MPSNDPTATLSYQSPDEDFVSIVDAPPAPALSMDRNAEWLVLAERPSLPSIEEIAKPELRLAGLRINPQTNGPSRASYLTSLLLRHIPTNTDHKVSGLPKSPRLSYLSWSPSGEYLAFAQTDDSGIRPWLLDLRSKVCRPLGEIYLNGALGGNPLTWMPDSSGLLINSLPDRGLAPEKPQTPEGPVITESTGEVAAVRTYQDLLQDRYDEAIFRFYTTSVIVKMNLDGTFIPITGPGIYSGSSPSPDGAYILISKVVEPFSYLVTWGKFPREIDLLTIEGTHVRNLAVVPGGESIPKGFMATRLGPRSFSWRSDKSATLYWVEAQDGGDPATEAKIRDKLFHLDAPFSGEPVVDMELSLRFAGLIWGTGDLAVVQEYWWSNRQIITSFWSPDGPQIGRNKSVLFDRSWEDRYNDPGHFETTTNQVGRSVLLTDQTGQSLFLTGQGASPRGNFPFLDRFRREDNSTERVWQSVEPTYELVLHIINPDRLIFLTRKESQFDPPNYYIRNLHEQSITPITEFLHPYPEVGTLQKELVRYPRKDGVSLTANLYLPPGYDPETDGTLPVMMWAYPEEFKSSDAAGQVQGSPYHFVRIGWFSPLFWLLRGVAVLDDPAMPIVGEGEAEPNDRFIEQLSMNAKAAVDFLIQRGISDGRRIAVGGHSYGAFMTANLLAHTDLFACGIARSGAYNRTLTPFGFQAEERSYWEARETYTRMSPFSYADQITAPMLLIHGAADNNSGTYPMQSERFFNALKGHGTIARLVMLPHESHGYTARESILHMLWEMDRFLQQYLYSASPEP